MIEQLFGSKTRVKLLQLFYGNVNRPFYVREITRKIDEQINSVRRELANLLSIGILTSETNNNRLYYEVNQQYEHYASLSAMFGGQPAPAAAQAKAGTKASKADKVPAVAKASADSDEVKAIKSLGNVELALFTGQFTRDVAAGIDFLLVGDINQTQLNKYIEELEAKEGKEIRYTCMPVSEFDYRREVNDRFLTTVLEAKKQILIDKQNSLKE
ncbi:MAG: transcriptional regulator [Candidatus Saccharimonadales bacterium]